MIIYGFSKILIENQNNIEKLFEISIS